MSRGELTNPTPSTPSCPPQRTAIEIEEKVKLAKQTEVSIAKAREVYRPVATRGSLVYFLIDNLNALDRVYHYSMANFVYVLIKGMDMTPGGKDESKVRRRGTGVAAAAPTGVAAAAAAAKECSMCCTTLCCCCCPHVLTQQQLVPVCTHLPPHLPVLHLSLSPSLPCLPSRSPTPPLQVPEPERLGQEEPLERRVELLVETTCYVVFAYIAQGLFERHKLIVATQLCMSILKARGELNFMKFDFLLRGPKVMGVDNPLADWVSDSVWGSVQVRLQGGGGRRGGASDHRTVAEGWCGVQVRLYKRLKEGGGGRGRG